MVFFPHSTAEMLKNYLIQMWQEHNPRQVLMYVTRVSNKADNIQPRFAFAVFFSLFVLLSLHFSLYAFLYVYPLGANW